MELSSFIFYLSPNITANDQNNPESNKYNITINTLSESIGKAIAPTNAAKNTWAMSAEIIERTLALALVNLTNIDIYNIYLILCLLLILN